ncbi:MAG: Fic family protein [Rudaea sp.]|uniref:Fic family protein n=1 Tax=Rudaea sp. TaxID=2136325 RepID=UPI0039E49502
MAIQQFPDKPLPELLFASEDDASGARRIQRLAREGRARRLYAGIYTSNLQSPIETIVLRHWRSIVGHLLPGGVVSYRSAFDGSPKDDQFFVTRGRTRRTLTLPGLTVAVVPGAGPVHSTPAQTDSPLGDLFLASDPRRFLENLRQGRGWPARVLPQTELEARLDRILMLGGERRLNQLRDDARSLASQLQMEAEFQRLDGLIGALLGTQESKRLTAAQALARAAGRPYDPNRLHLFDALFEKLHNTEFADIPDPAARGTAREAFAFFESYFSNYIEGTTFTVEEAKDIVFHGRIAPNRSEDSHDVLGTFQAALNSPWRDQPAQSPEAFLDWLRKVHALVMQKRPDKNPGEWKDRANQAGNTLFVLPELVPGTLREGFERLRSLRHPLARAIMAMFVVAEVHPFIDGNGRTARLAMNCELSAAGQCRILIPTVYREDYLLPLKALSLNADAEPIMRAMTRIQRWSGAFDYALHFEELRFALERCHAFEEDLRNFKLVFPERIERS